MAELAICFEVQSEQGNFLGYPKGHWRVWIREVRPGWHTGGWQTGVTMRDRAEAIGRVVRDLEYCYGHYERIEIRFVDKDLMNA